MLMITYYDKQYFLDNQLIKDYFILLGKTLSLVEFSMIIRLILENFLIIKNYCLLDAVIYANK